MTQKVPTCRVRKLNKKDVREKGQFVLYWMTSFRRTHHNFALDHAVDYAQSLKRPLLVLEALRLDYPYASVRLHKFILEGMRDNQAACEHNNVTYYPYVEPKKKAGSGLLYALADEACCVVTDDYPANFIPNMIAHAAGKVSCALDAVDANGMLPLNAAEKAHARAYDFRRMLQKTLPSYLGERPRKQPLRAEHVVGAKIPPSIVKKWPIASAKMLEASDDILKTLDIDQEVGPAAFSGGSQAAEKKAKEFVKNGLSRYADDRNHPDRKGGSGLSPYLHFGHISTHQIFEWLEAEENWKSSKLSEKTNGAREGWWGMSAAAEAFLDELITWRELSYNTAYRLPDFAKYKSLPEWAQATLKEHASDPRETTYSLKQLQRGETDDPVWNAAQNQLVREGRLHNYMRMLWGKRVLAWCETPERALEILIELNNRFGVDGRDPNSFGGIFWVFGRYDRPWPTHAVFGKIRMMSSASTKRKLDVKNYIEDYTS